MDGKTHTHTNTHPKRTALPAEWNREATKVTSDIKADQQTSKEHPGKHHGKTHQEKGTLQKWIHTMPRITMHHYETR